ncbi:MAG: diguanylate cyclase [Pseudomonadota bacterium]|nr:MAG: diguanylate cyclase [Pseudomonadota bacterium]
MKRATRYSRAFYLIISAMVALLLTLSANTRMKDFVAYQRDIAAHTVEATSSEIARHIKERRRQVELFVDDQDVLIELMVQHPENDHVIRQVSRKLEAYFPDRHSFTVTDDTVRPIVAGIDFTPVDVCLDDARAALEGKPQPVRLHPNLDAYHYDIIVPWRANTRGGVFFISFLPDGITNLLRLASPHGHHLMLLNRDIEGLIEITDQGARNKLKRGDFHISAAERGRILAVAPIAETAWQLVIVHDAALFTRQRDKIIYQTLLAFALYLGLGYMMLRRLQAEERRRSAVESQLRASTAQLEQANIELQRIARTDKLTGIANRRRFDEEIELELKRTRRSNHPLSLLMIDVDQFKNYNDTYGHKQGDATLREVAQCIESCLRRPSDFVARYGGEEFVVVLPDTPLEGALKIAENIRSAVAALRIPHDSSTIVPYVTISLGVAPLPPGAQVSTAQLVDMADTAMYSAKEGGRNRVATREALNTARQHD